MPVIHQLFLSLFGRKTADKKSTVIYITVIVSGFEKKRLSTGVSVPASNFKSGKLIGRSATIFNIEKKINLFKDQLEESFNELLKEKVTPFPEAIIERFNNRFEEEKTINDILDHLVDKKTSDFKKGDASSDLPEKFRVLRGDVQRFMAEQYSRKDIPLRMVNFDFVDRFSIFLRNIPNANITVNKKMSNLSQGFLYAVKNEWMKRNPIEDWKPLQEPKTNRERLTEGQFEQLLQFKLPNETHERIKDTFIFMCLTGMAFSDIRSFTFSQVTEIQGVSSIVYVRNKMKKYQEKVFVPVFPQTMAIINKYYMKPIRKGKRGKTDRTEKDPVFDLPVGQTYNEKLKVLFEFNDMELEFSISSHCGRKTFGHLITKWMGLEAASHFLGHTRISTTEESYVDNKDEDLYLQRSAQLLNGVNPFNNN